MTTIIVGLIVFALIAAIIGRGIWNRRHRKGGCSCSSGCAGCSGCSGCPGSSFCHPEAASESEKQ